MATTLRIEHLVKRFEGLVAVNDLSIDVQEREIHALIGPNGSGKSTLLSQIAGIYQSDEGRILLDGAEYAPRSALEANSRGIAMVVQELGTVMEQKAPVKMILLNNNFLGNVRQWQAMFFNRRYSFTPMMNPDYLKIASAYGIPARRALTRKELAEAIEEMISTDGPFLLEACVEEEGNVMPMTPPGGSVNQMLLEC